MTMAPTTERFGLVLAAGSGARMGGPKAFLEVDGAPLVEQHVCRLVDAGCRLVCVVVRRDDHARALQALRDQRAAVVIAANTTSQAESLDVGLRALELAGDKVVVVTPVDMLPVATTTILELVAAVDGSIFAASPRYRGRGGHPIAARVDALAELGVDARGATPLRVRLDALGCRRARIDVDAPAVVADFDVPADLPRHTSGARGA